MQLIKLPKGKHQCLIYATAMLLGITPEQVIETVGHDGSEIWWPQLESPWGQRGIHMQEILDVVEATGQTLVCYQLMPTSVPIDEGLQRRAVFELKRAKERFSLVLGVGPGILITARHACAWDGSKVYDPNGRIEEIQDYRIKELWQLRRI